MMTEPRTVDVAPAEPAASLFDGHLLVKICKETLPGQSDAALVDRLQRAYAGYPIALARGGHTWYRLGGIIKPDGTRIAGDLSEWAERTYIECGHDFDTLLDYCGEQGFIATRHRGVTLYLVAKTGEAAEHFVQIEIDRTQEMADRLLIDPDNPPVDLEELIDPIEPVSVEPFSIGAARYTYRRKTEVAVFMAELARHRADRHPAQRFMDDWNASSAGRSKSFCEEWSLVLQQQLGRHGERLMNVEVVPNRSKDIPHLDAIAGKKGPALAALLSRFDSQAGYPFAWFFYTAKGLIETHLAESVNRDLSKDYAYLPAKDAAVLKAWFAAPYWL
jgi:hypothetical protein